MVDREFLTQRFVFNGSFSMLWRYISGLLFVSRPTCTFSEVIKTISHAGMTNVVGHEIFVPYCTTVAWYLLRLSHHQDLGKIFSRRTNYDWIYRPEKIWCMTICVTRICSGYIFPTRGQVLIQNVWSVYKREIVGSLESNLEYPNSLCRRRWIIRLRAVVS